MREGQLRALTRLTPWRGASRTLAAVVAGWLLSTTLAWAAAVETPADWLQRMEKAPAHNSYRGLFVYENSHGLTALQVVHRVVEGQIHERLVYQDGPYREILRRGERVAFIRPDGFVSHFQPDNVDNLITRLARYQDKLRSSYRLLFSGSDRVAGREVIRVEVQPRDNHRYGYFLWLDRATGLLLRSEMVGEKGAVLERFQYVSITPGEDIAAAELSPSREVVWNERAATRVQPVDVARLDWNAGWVPSGFEVTGRSRVPSPVSNQPADSVMYSDGLGSFSIFVEREDSSVVGPASEQIGATSAVSRLFRRGDSYYNVTVIGELPLGTAERVAVSVKPVETVEQASAGQSIAEDDSSADGEVGQTNHK